MKNYITIGIMIALQGGKRYTAKELAIKFETSVKTIYRSIDSLLQAGMPIISLQGKNGGYELMKECSLNSSFFTMDELCSFISFLKSNSEKLYGGFSIDDRLSQIFDKNLITNINDQSKQLVIDTSLWGHSTSHRKITEDMKDFISKKVKVKLKYINSKTQEIEERIIHPYTLVYKSNSWYIYGFCEKRNSFRLFKMSKIIDYSSLSQIFSYQNVDILSKPWNSDYKSSLELICVELICPALLLNDITDWLEQVVLVKPIENNLMFIKGKAFYSTGLIHKLIEYGNKIQVLKPEKLKDSICLECLNIYNLYNKKDAINS